MTRSRQTARAAGTRWETAIVNFLQEKGWPHAERRARRGKLDAGDITGVPFCVEAKDHNRHDFAGWVDQAREESVNAKTEVWCAWVKRNGKSSPGDAYVVTDGHVWAQLLKEAGY